MLNPLRGKPWSAFCNVGFIVLGVFQIFPAAFPGWGIDQPLGTIAFLVVFAALVIVSIAAAFHDSNEATTRHGELVGGNQRIEKGLAEVKEMLERKAADEKERNRRLDSGEAPDSPKIRKLDLKIQATQEALNIRLGDIFKLTST